MEDAQELAASSLWMSLGIVLIALFLALRQWYERRPRDPDLPQEERSYFFRQDLRRGFGVAVMLLLAAGISVGTRIEPMIARQANLNFVKIWLGVIVLILVLLALAFFDWWATRRYARRLRHSITRERVELLRQTFRSKTDTHDEQAPEADSGSE